MPARGSTERIPTELCVEVSVDVDKSGGNNPTSRVYLSLASPDVVAYLANPVTKDPTGNSRWRDSITSPIAPARMTSPMPTGGK